MDWGKEKSRDYRKTWKVERPFDSMDCEMCCVLGERGMNIGNVGRMDGGQ